MINKFISLLCKLLTSCTELKLIISFFKSLFWEINSLNLLLNLIELSSNEIKHNLLPDFELIKSFMKPIFFELEKFSFSSIFSAKSKDINFFNVSKSNYYI